MANQNGHHSPEDIAKVIASALIKIGKNELNLAADRLELAVRMLRELQKQKSLNRRPEQK
jgi:hypothetical protein